MFAITCESLGPASVLSTIALGLESTFGDPSLIVLHALSLHATPVHTSHLYRDADKAA